MKIVIATGNKGKLREIKSALDGLSLEFLSLGDFPGFVMPPETRSTFAENALIKAHAIFSATGLCALSDDSGLEVEYLNGAPGIRSARYAAEDSCNDPSDEQNVDKLLFELNGVPVEQRGARFKCVLAFVGPGSGTGDGTGKGLDRTFEGHLNGRITEARVGSGGFGYDPVFYIPPLGCTAAELSLERKGEISHRGEALRKFRVWLDSSGFL